MRKKKTLLEQVTEDLIAGKSFEERTKTEFEQAIIDLKNDNTPKRVKKYTIKTSRIDTYPALGKLFYLLDFYIRREYKKEYTIKPVIVPVSLEGGKYCQSHKGWEFYVGKKKVALIKHLSIPYFTGIYKVILEWYDKDTEKELFKTKLTSKGNDGKTIVWAKGYLGEGW